MVNDFYLMCANYIVYLETVKLLTLFHIDMWQQLTVCARIAFYLQGNLELENGSTVYGFAFVDCAALKLWVGCIKDDASFAGLGALLMQVCSHTTLCTVYTISQSFRNWTNCLFGFDYRCHLKKFCTKVEVNIFVHPPHPQSLSSFFLVLVY